MGINEYLKKESAESMANMPKILTALIGEKVIGYMPVGDGYLIVFESLGGLRFGGGHFSLENKVSVKRQIESEKHDLEETLGLMEAIKNLVAAVNGL